MNNFQVPSAIEVRNACKQYGKRNDVKVVLSHLNMTVSKGSIYALLGASGCGKTTLLSCIMGMIPLESGEIKVLGSYTKSDEIHEKGSRIGYMPQEMALIGELTVKETVYYFGNIFQMDIDKLRDRYEMIRKLLELPYDGQKVEECSGGQKRRVSFAAAMIHEPDLLILDEPTVGLDPLLREKIWKFMLDITRTSKLAIVITTHYIDEARQADFVGLMRNGILLAEDPPVNILNKLGVENLEEAFLQLCLKKGVSDEASDETLAAITENNNHTEQIEMRSNASKTHQNSNLEEGHEKKKKSQGLRWQLIKALLVKNSLQLKRQPGAIIFLTLLPFFQLFFFYHSIGGNPRGLKLGIVDEEISNYSECLNTSLITTFVHDYSCDLHKISCRVLGEITDDIALKVFYDNFDDAFKEAKKGNLAGIIHFSSNFTESLNNVHSSPDDVDPQTRKNSVINIHLDQTNQQITYYLQRKLYDVYKEYSHSVLADCNLPTRLDDIPIQFLKPIYGSYDTDFKHTMVPSFIMLFMFYLAAGLTVASIIYERKEGFWNRTLLAGVSTKEMMLAHVIISVTILAVQLCEVMTLLTLVVSTDIRGSYFTVSLLIALVGCSGIFFGLWCSCMCTTFMEANLLMTGISQPMIVVSGMFWPVEGMPWILRILSYATPTGPFSSISVRHIMEKGYTITHPSVYAGFIVLIIWVVLCALLGLITLERRKYSRNT